MNVFALDLDSEIAAQSLADQHINKMIVESCQLLAAAHAGVTPYEKTHVNHPCARWVRESPMNYAWLVAHAYALLAERNFRWPERLEHASARVLDWYADAVWQAYSDVAPMTPFAQAMPQQYKRADAVEAYRSYYTAEKTSFKRGLATWTRREKPNWLAAAATVGRPTSS